MSKQNILVGASANDKSGDTLRNAFIKVNANFTELYALTGGSSAALIELAQDYAAPLFTHASHTNITVTYDDANNKILLTGAAAQVQSNWTASSGLGVILNKPTLFSGSYTDLTNKPTIPSAYTLPTASASILGGIKIGTGLSIDGSGVVTASSGSVSTLVNGARTVSLGSDGTVTLPNFDIMAGVGSKIKSALDIKIQTGAYYLSNLSALYSDFFTLVFSISSAPNWATVVAVGDYVISRTCVMQITAVAAPDANIGEWRITLSTDDFTGASDTFGVSSWSFYKPGATNSIWTFGKNGNLTFPNATVQTTAWLGSVSTLVNSTQTVSLSSSGVLTLPSGLTFRKNGTPYSTITADLNKVLQIETQTSGGVKQWSLGTDGSLTFPDASVQTTAWTGSVSSLVNGGSTLSLASTGVLTFPSNTIKSAVDTALAVTTQETVVTTSPTYNNAQAFSRDITVNGTFIQGWYQRNPSQIEFALFGTPAFVTYVTGLALGTGMGVVYETSGGQPNLFTGTITQAFTTQGQYDPAHPTWQRVSGRVDGTLPNNTGIRSVSFSTSSTVPHNFTFGTDGALTLPNGAVIKDTAGNSVVFGEDAGTTSQGANAVAIGTQAGNSDQGTETVAIGALAGISVQGQGAVAVGFGAGYNLQGVNSVAIGKQAGLGGQGANAIAIGYRAGDNNQAANTIILNASGVIVNSVAEQPNSFYVAPIRTATATSNVLYYNTTTKEVTYGSAPSLGNFAFSGDTLSNTLSNAITLQVGGNNYIFGSSGQITLPDASVIASYKPVTVIAQTSTTRTIIDQASAAYILFTETVDTANAYANGVFTAPYTGYYQFNVSIYFSTSVTLNSGSFFLIDSSDGAKTVTIMQDAWSGRYLHYSTVVQATAGDTIHCFVLRNASGANIDLASGCRLTIHRVSIS